MIDLSREVSGSLGPARSGRLQKKSGKGPIRRRTLNRLSRTPLLTKKISYIKSSFIKWNICFYYCVKTFKVLMLTDFDLILVSCSDFLLKCNVNLNL